MPALNQFAGRARRLAQGEPGNFALNGAREQPHPLVFQVQLEGAVRPAFHLAEVDLTRPHDDNRGSTLTRELVEEQIQSVIGVAVAGAPAGRHRQVGPAETPQKPLKEALREHFVRGVPVSLRGQNQFVERVTGLAGGKDERCEESLGPDGDGTGFPRRYQGETVMMAVECLVRVEAGTGAADMGHEGLHLQTLLTWLARRSEGHIGQCE